MPVAAIVVADLIAVGIGKRDDSTERVALVFVYVRLGPADAVFGVAGVLYVALFAKTLHLAVDLRR